MRLGWLIAAGSGALLAGSAPAAVTEYAPVPAEAGNKAPLCIRWSFTEEQAGDANAPDRVRLIPTFRNQCTRDAHVAIYWYYGSLEKIARKRFFTVPAMQSYGDASTATVHIPFSRTKHKELRIWVLESPHPFVKGNLPDTSRCDKKFNPRKKAPACPKYFTY